MVFVGTPVDRECLPRAQILVFLHGLACRLNPVSILTFEDVPDRV